MVDHQETKHCSLHGNRQRFYLDINKRSILSSPPAYYFHTAQLVSSSLSVRPRFGLDLRIVRNEIVHIASNSFLGAVSEQAFGCGVPGNHIAVEIHDHNCCGTVLEEGLEIFLLTGNFSEQAGVLDGGAHVGGNGGEQVLILFIEAPRLLGALHADGADGALAH